jgi:hypothetical protein
VSVRLRLVRGLRQPLRGCACTRAQLRRKTGYDPSFSTKYSRISWPTEKLSSSRRKKLQYGAVYVCISLDTENCEWLGNSSTVFGESRLIQISAWRPALTEEFRVFPQFLQVITQHYSTTDSFLHYSPIILPYSAIYRLKNIYIYIYTRTFTHTQTYIHKTLRAVSSPCQL